MYFKFDDAEALINEIMSLILDLKKYDEYQNYALLYTEFSRYNFFKNDYEEVSFNDLKTIFILITLILASLFFFVNFIDFSY